MTFERTETAHWMNAIWGMRNPMNSQHLIDSKEYIMDNSYISESNPIPEGSEVIKTVGGYSILLSIGRNDLDLMQRLIRGGTEHRKFMRQITITTQVEMPRCVWTEFDTYKVGTTRNSASTMHKLFNKDYPISLDMFTYDKKDEEELISIISKLNKIRKDYLETKDAALLERAKMLVPEGLLMKSMWSGNYENVYNMREQRKSHRLSHWNTDFMNWSNSLPYAEVIF